MKSQTINSYPFSESLLVNPIQETASLDSIRVRNMIRGNDMNIMAIRIDPNARPDTLFCGAKIPKEEPMRERDLSTEELLNLFDRKESVRMVYMPHFITQCIIYYLDLLVAYLIDNRLSDYKKHTRFLKEIRAEYYEALRHEMPYHVFQKFEKQRDEYLESCGGNLTLMYFTFGNEILKRHGHIDHENIFCYANIIVAFIDYVEDFDSQVNKKIAAKMGKPCRNHGDARLTAIKDVCTIIKNKYPIESNDQTRLCVNVMANKATAMINTLL